MQKVFHILIALGLAIFGVGSVIFGRVPDRRDA